MIYTSAQSDMLRAFRSSGDTAAVFLEKIKPSAYQGFIMLDGSWTPNSVNHARRVLRKLDYLQRTADCGSCGEPGTKLHECPKSERPCGHHCNHVWEHDECDWCGATFGDEASPQGERS